MEHPTNSVIAQAPIVATTPEIIHFTHFVSVITSVAAVASLRFSAGFPGQPQIPDLAPVVFALSSDLEGLFASPRIRVIAPPEAEGRNLGIFLMDRQILGHLVYVRSWTRLSELCWEIELDGVDELMEQPVIPFGLEAELADWICGDVDQVVQIPGVEVRMFPEGYRNLSREERQAFALESMRSHYFRQHPDFDRSMGLVRELGISSAFFGGIDMSQLDEIATNQGRKIYYNQIEGLKRPAGSGPPQPLQS